MKLRAPSKVNLHLKILAREQSGYHQIETLFCATDLHDEIEISRDAEGLHLDITGPNLGPVEQNLAFRAAVAFYEAVQLPPHASIELSKHIPAGAGLGGGSSDAATVLVGLNSLYQQPLSERALLQIAATLGSDVPFFVARTPLALAWGRGERLHAIDPLPLVPLLLATPEFPVVTAEAYAALARHREIEGTSSTATMHGVDAFKSWDNIREIAQNDFEVVVFALFPLLGEIRTTLADEEAMFSLLSGSGSTVFGVFSDDGERDRAIVRIEESFPGVRALSARTVDAPWPLE